MAGRWCVSLRSTHPTYSPDQAWSGLVFAPAATPGYHDAMPPFFLKRRHLQPELMDQPRLDKPRHYQALDGLHRLNVASGTCRQLWRSVRATLGLRQRRLRMLDVASGGGDVPLGMWKLAQRDGVDLEILGVDASLAACEYAASRAQPHAASFAFKQLDVTREQLPAGFDVVTCSLFLHHLTAEQASDLLTNMAAAGELLLVSDLRRSAGGYALAQLACRMLTCSPIVRSDGPQSVANAFTLGEMRELCERAGIKNATTEAVWPFRLMVMHQAR